MDTLSNILKNITEEEKVPYIITVCRVNKYIGRVKSFRSCLYMRNTNRIMIE